MDYTAYFPILLQIVIIFLVIGGLLTGTHLLGPRNNLGNKRTLYECGVERKGDARSGFAIKYFLVAILFVLFDVEVVFFYPYAVSFKGLGWYGFTAILLFTGFFASAFYYLIKKQVLTWDD